jgi:hypothetical protein
MFQRSFASVLFALLMSFPALGQVVDRIVPEVFAPGDVVTLHGQGLAALTEVDFTAIVGGFVGSLTIVQPIAVATDTEVLVVAPLFNAFVPPFAGSSPFGFVGGTLFPSLPAFYTEGTFGQLTTAGKGSPTPGAAFAKLVVSFELASGAPVPGNADFTLKLESSPPGAAAFVAAGMPDATPRPFAGGVLAVDLLAPFLLIGPFPVNAKGDAEALLPIPATVGATVALQWFTRDPATNALLISNALIAEL